MKVTRKDNNYIIDFGADTFNCNVKACVDDFLKALEQTQDKMYALLSKGIEVAPKNKFDGVKMVKEEDKHIELPELDLGLEQGELQ